MGAASTSVRDVPERSRYEIEEGGEPVGLLAYYLAGGEISLVHVEVDPAHGGRGLGSALTREVLHDARVRGLKVRPLCPFAIDYIARHAGVYDDILV